MKRGLKRMIITAICLAVCLAAGAACASGASDGPIITFESYSGDGHYWVDQFVTIMIDVTDAAEAYLTTPRDSEPIALHTNSNWSEPDPDEGWIWGEHHEQVRATCDITDPGAFSVTVRACWAAPDEPEGVIWKENTATIQAETRGELAAPQIALGNLNGDGGITRGEPLDVYVTIGTPADGSRVSFGAEVYAADAQGQETGDPLITWSSFDGINIPGSRGFFLPTWDLEGGDYVLVASEYCEGYRPDAGRATFTVTDTGAQAPQEPVWTFSKTTVDTEDAFDVCVYIPGADHASLDISQEEGVCVTCHSLNNMASIRNIRLPNDNEITFTATGSFPTGEEEWDSVDYPYTGSFTINEAVNGPWPEIEGPGAVMIAGQDLTFSVETYSGTTVQGKPVSYEIRINYSDDVYTVLDEPGEVTIPWETLCTYGSTEPGSSITIIVRSYGQGYNSQQNYAEYRIIETAAEGPAITFEGETEDGHYWLDDYVRIRIDATDAEELYVKDSISGSFSAFHKDSRWEWWLEDEDGWGLRHENVNYTRWLSQAGDFTVTVQAYVHAPTDDDPDAMIWKIGSATVRVDPHGEIAAPAVTVGGLDENGHITRGNILDVSVTMSGGQYYEVCLYGTDKNGKIIESYEDMAGYTEGYEDASFSFGTWDLTGDYVLNVTEYREGYLPGEFSMPFKVVTGENFVLPTEPLWTVSKTSVDTGEPFDVSVYIPADETQFGNPYTSLWIEQDGESVYYKDMTGNFCALRNVILESDAPVTIGAYRSYPNGGEVEITYEGPFTVNPAVDAPAPVITGLGLTHPIGQDLTFTIGNAEGEEPAEGKPVTYQVRFYMDGRIIEQRVGTGPVTIPWEKIRKNYGTEPAGDKITLYIRAGGRGYNSKVTHKEIILCKQADDDFRIAFAGTNEEHIRLVVRQQYTLTV